MDLGAAAEGVGIAAQGLSIWLTGIIATTAVLVLSSIVLSVLDRRFRSNVGSHRRARHLSAPPPGAE